MSSDEIRLMVAEALREELRKAATVQPESDRYLSVAEAAVLSGLDVSTIRSWFGKKLTRYGGKRSPRVLESELRRAMRPTPTDLNVSSKADELLRGKH